MKCPVHIQFMMGGRTSTCRNSLLKIIMYIVISFFRNHILHTHPFKIIVGYTHMIGFFIRHHFYTRFLMIEYGEHIRQRI